MLDAALAQARERADQALQAADAHAHRITGLETRIAQAARLPQATEDDRELVATAVSRDLPGKLARLPELRQRAEARQQANRGP